MLSPFSLMTVFFVEQPHTQMSWNTTFHAVLHPPCENRCFKHPFQKVVREARLTSVFNEEQTHKTLRLKSPTLANSFRRHSAECFYARFFIVFSVFVLNGIYYFLNPKI